MITYAVSYEIIKNKSIKVSGITYTEAWEAEEDIGVFSFDKLIYKDTERDEFLAVKKPRRSRVWKNCRNRKDIVKLIYLKAIVDDYSGIWLWLLTENWGISEVEQLKTEEVLRRSVLERFRERREEIEREFFGGERVASYIWGELLYFKVIERMNGPNALIISTEPIERYFRMLPIIIDIG